MSDAPPSPDSLVEALQPHYPLARNASCQLIQDGLNTHYLIESLQGRYVLRLYRRGWRTPADIAYELAVLSHLATGGLAVCGPIARRDGAAQTVVEADDGPRAAVLFPYAPGEPPDLTNPEALRACGRTMALIHRHTDGFTCPHERFRLDLGHLLDQPLAVVLRLLAHRPTDAAFVAEAVAALRTGLASQAPTLEWGFCHADFHGGNLRRDTDGTLWVFDFDCGGPGWRAYDLAVCRLFCQTESLWAGFCQAYREIRPLPEATLAALPWFIVARQVWRMAVFATHWPRFTGRPTDDEFINQQLGVLRERLHAYLPEAAGPG
ncbi:phosphotransferase [bacterium]|nr:phosphotransferase [bacterium]